MQTWINLKEKIDDPALFTVYLGMKTVYINNHNSEKQGTRKQHSPPKKKRKKKHEQPREYNIFIKDGYTLLKSAACMHAYNLLGGGSLVVKLPTTWTDEKRSQEEAEPGRNSDVEKLRREKIRDGESQKREDAGARKGRKVATHCAFPMFCGSGGSKSRFAKAAGAKPAGEMRDEKLHAVVARGTFGSKI